MICRDRRCSGICSGVGYGGACIVRATERSRRRHHHRNDDKVTGWRRRGGCGPAGSRCWQARRRKCRSRRSLFGRRPRRASRPSLSGGGGRCLRARRGGRGRPAGVASSRPIGSSRATSAGDGVVRARLRHVASRVIAKGSAASTRGFRCAIAAAGVPRVTFDGEELAALADALTLYTAAAAT